MKKSNVITAGPAIGQSAELSDVDDSLKENPPVNSKCNARVVVASRWGAPGEEVELPEALLSGAIAAGLVEPLP